MSAGSAQAIFPWLAATASGVDLVYYRAPKKGQTYYVWFVQNLASTPTGWGKPQRLVALHKGAICEEASRAKPAVSSRPRASAMLTSDATVAGFSALTWPARSQKLLVAETYY